MIDFSTRPLSESRLIRGIQLLSQGKLPHPLAHWLYQRKSRRWADLVASGQQFVPVKVGAGATLEVSTNSKLSECIFHGSFELGERRLVARHLGQGDIFLDIGANVGLFTVIAAKRVGPTGEVWAVEPSARTRVALQRNIQINGLSNVEVFACGVSDTVGTLTLNESVAGLDALNSFTTPLEEGPCERVDVPVMTLDKLVGGNAPRKPTLIKIDVEGWEGHVLQGGLEVLGSPGAPDLMVEFCTLTLQSAGTSCAELDQNLRQLGYEVFCIDKRTSLLTPAVPGIEYKYANLLATKNKMRFKRSMAG
jgi:FkbM family methyltransferase